MIKPKRVGTEMPMRTFRGRDGRDYLVFRTGRAFHVFTEVDAAEAARDCGATPKGTTTQQKWASLWKKAS